MQTSILWTALGLVLAWNVQAQLPQSNIYLFDLKQGDAGKLEFTNPRYLTAFNAQGYNNDPSFFSNTEIYLTVAQPGASKADIFKLDLLNLTKQQVTATPEGENMPIRMPEYYTFSAIRYESEGRDTVARLWQFPIDQLTGGKPIFKYINGIQAYYWLNSQDIVIYKEDNPSALSVVNTNNDKIETMATNIGRTFLRMPNGNLAYVQKSRYDDWQIMEKNLYRRGEQARPIIETLPGAEHFAILPDGTYIMAKGSKIYKYNKFTDDNWKEAADMRFYEIGNITKLVVSSDMKVAVVAD